VTARLPILILAAALALSPGCAARVGAGAAPGFEPWIREELWLGAEIPTGGQVTDEAWAEFVAAEVTPRFPDGFSVVEAAGHWRHPDGTPVRERTRVLVVLRPAGDAGAARALEAIAAAYVARFHQDAALRTADEVDVRFVEP
jgi:hypothetical protein